MRTHTLILLSTLTLAACGGRGLGGENQNNQNQPQDAGVTHDAAVTPDAALPADGGACVEGGTTLLRPTAIQTIMLLQDNVTEEGQTVRLVAGLELGGCEWLADVTYVVDAASREVLLTARRWADVAPDAICDGELAWYQEVLSLSGLTAGTWTARDVLGGPTGALATFEVSVCTGDFDCFCPAGSQPDPVPLGSECRYDCDCEAGLACMGSYGFDMLHFLCGRSCSVDADCLGWEQCEFAADGPYGQCYPAWELPADCTELTCPAGEACTSIEGLGAWCRPDYDVATTGETCGDDCDCVGALRCLDVGVGESAFCGAPCRGDLDCPVGALCAEGTGPAGPVCYLMEF